MSSTWQTARIAAALLICLSAPAAAQGLAETIDQAFSPVAKAVSELDFYKIPIGDAELQLIVVWLVAAFSNEAGIGSSSIAHAAVKTREPISQGYVAML